MKQLYLLAVAKMQHFPKFNYFSGILAFTFIFNLQAYAQQIEWDKTYGGNQTDVLQAMQQTSDGGYILGGSSSSGISGDKTEANRLVISNNDRTTDYWVVKLDAAGNKEWDRTYGGDLTDDLQVVQQTADGGYILGGFSESGLSGDKSEASKGKYDYWIVKLDAGGNKQWDRTFGGAESDVLYTLAQISDGGYILGGFSASNVDGDKSHSSKGGNDFWIIKLDASGQMQWDKTIGGVGNDLLYSIVPTNDDGFILAGSSDSNVSEDKSQASQGGPDYWIVKLDDAGNLLWDKTFGGADADYLLSIIQTIDGGYLVGGNSFSDRTGDKTEELRGICDYWVLKLDNLGNKEWDRTLGGDQVESLSSIIQTGDGNYLIGGDSNSEVSGNKSEAPVGGAGMYQQDYWIVKLDKSGTQLWDSTIGGTSTDNLGAVIETNDRGYLLGGNSFSNSGGNKSENAKGSDDYWIVKLDWEAVPPTGDVCYSISFEDDRKGLISKTGTAAGEVTITGKKRNSDGFYAPGNYAAIFDTGMPTGDDNDLHTFEWGNVLIINQDLTAVPNDNQWGGELILDFSAFGPVTTASMKVLDIDQYEDDSWVYLYNSAGVELFKTRLQPLGNNSKQTVNLGNTSGVMSMRVVLGGTGIDYVGSAAIDAIAFCVDEQDEQQTTEIISQVSAYPNPMKKRSVVEFKLSASEFYTVNLYDAKGNKIKELQSGQGEENEVIEVPVDGEMLLNGLYFARIITSSGSKTIKLILRK